MGRGRAQALCERRVRLDLECGQVADLGDRQPPLAHGLDHVERCEDEKDVADQDDASQSFARVHVGEHTQQPFETRVSGTAIGACCLQASYLSQPFATILICS